MAYNKSIIKKSIVILCVHILVISESTIFNKIDENVAEDSRLTTPQLVQKYGYSSELHNVQTEDGYILEMHRIADSPKSKDKKSIKPVVFMMHGLPSTSAEFVFMGPEISLGYYAADHGYDVWMGNTRGNRYGRKHITLSPEEPKFWNYTWHEIGIYDLPAMIDYVLMKTNQSIISYIGFSQGTTTFFVMCSERPEYLKKFSHMQALAPVVYLTKTNSRLLRIAGYFTTKSDVYYMTHGPYEFLPNTDFMRRVGHIFCEGRTITRSICAGLLFELTGYDYAQLNGTMLPIILGHFPAGASNLQIAHYGQLIDNDNFHKYDFGRKKNLKKYGQSIPPNYNLTSLKLPIALHYANNDVISHPDDIDRLHKELPNVIGLFKPSHKDFNHLDYIVAIDIRKLMYNKILEILKMYT